MLLGVLLLGLSPEDANNKKKIVYLFLITIILGLLGGYRSSLVGCDTANYYDSFLRTSDNIEGIFDNNQHIETGFAALCTLVKICGGNFTHFLLVCSFFIVGSFSVFVFRHSNNVLLSIFILLCFPYYYSSFDIIRHFFATSFLLLGFKYILKGNFLKYAIFILMGSVFHNSALVYLLLYPLLRLGWSRRLFLFITAATLFLMISANNFANFLVAETGRFEVVAEEWVGEYSGGVLTCIMYLLVFLLAYYARKNKTSISIEYDVSIICIYMLLMSALLFINVRIALRYIMTFSGLLAFAMPSLLGTVDVQKRNINRVLLIIFISIGVFYHLFMLEINWQNVVPYVPSFVYPYI